MLKCQSTSENKIHLYCHSFHNTVTFTTTGIFVLADISYFTEFILLYFVGYYQRIEF